MGVAVVGSLFAAGYRASIDAHAKGLGLAGATIQRARQSAGAALEAAGAVGGTVGRALTAVVDDAFVHGMRVGLGASVVVAVGGAVLALRFLPARGREHHLNATDQFPAEGPAEVPVDVPVDVVVDDTRLEAELDLAREP
jgi:hypothetical protein